MKQNNIPKESLPYVVIGLLMTTITPLISRIIPLPDFLKGFIVGLGLMLEVIGLIKAQKDKKANKCSTLNKKH